VARVGHLERGIDARGIRPRPRPETLRALARGLAAGPDERGHDARAGELYERLLAAAGYLQPRAARVPADRAEGAERAAADADALLDELWRELLALEPRQRAAAARALRAFVATLPPPGPEPPTE
jgi:hypothetical protein